jgi:AbrB family looped-hinge helix DNA binding protein
MTKRKKLEDYCSEMGEGNSYQVQSLVSVDERGQMVLPKDVREKAQINPGDKLALITWEKKGECQCIILIKAEELGDMVRGFLEPDVSNSSK